MSFGNRRWFIVAGGSLFHGKLKLNQIYHYVLGYTEKDGYETACGMKGARGEFVDLRLTKKQELAARCEKCVAVRRKK